MLKITIFQYMLKLVSENDFWGQQKFFKIVHLKAQNHAIRPMRD